MTRTIEITSEVEAAAARNKISFERLDAKTVDQLRARVRDVHCSDAVPHAPWLWATFHDASSVQDPEGWKLLSALPLAPLLLWGDAKEGEWGWRIATAADLVRILADYPGFEFYVSDEDGGFVVCFNHHDNLIGVGSAKSWISHLIYR